MENLGDKRIIDSFDSNICSSNTSSYDLCSKECCSSPVSLKCPIRNARLVEKFGDVSESESEREIEAHLDDDSEFRQLGSRISEMELTKERFAKLLLGEDMSSSGKGVCSALAISNAITNLYASVFGQLWRLEPLQYEKKQMWQREMDCLLCVCDHIVELIPSLQTFPNGSKLEIMTSRPRSDICINLPALRKLDNMLLEMLDSFISTEFGYIDPGIVAPDVDVSSHVWMPMPRIPIGGLPEHTRKELTQKRECANQILKVVMEINGVALAEMEVPESYFESLPKNVKECLGDVIYRYIKSEKFSAECLLDCLDLSSQLVALDITNRVETSIYIWRKRVHSIPNLSNPNRLATKFSWDMFKDLLSDGFKRDSLANRAESFLLCLKQRFLSLNQTSLDITKIQHNKDVGKSILESYSRVLKKLASNIMALINDLLYVDDLTRQSYNIPLHVGATTHKRPIPCITFTEMSGSMGTYTSVSGKENQNPNMLRI